MREPVALAFTSVPEELAPEPTLTLGTRNVPGLILFLLGYPLIVGWWSILLLPISLALFGCLRLWQDRHVFRRLDVDVGNNARGFIGYLFVYQVLTSAALRSYG